MTNLSYLFLPLVLFATACAPTIYNFDATPSSVCKGASSTLRWKSTHRGSITATPPNESPGSVFSEGSSVVTPQASGTYHLESTNIVLSSSRDVRVEVTDACAPAAPAAAPAAKTRDAVKALAANSGRLQRRNAPPRRKNQVVADERKPVHERKLTPCRGCFIS